MDRIYFTQQQAANEIKCHVSTLRKVLNKNKSKYKKCFHGNKLTRKEVERLRSIYYEM